MIQKEILLRSLKFFKDYFVFQCPSWWVFCCPRSFTKTTRSLSLSPNYHKPLRAWSHNKTVFRFYTIWFIVFQCPIQPIESGVVTSASVIVKTHYSFILTITSGSQELCRFVVKRAPLLIDFTLVQHKQWALCTIRSHGTEWIMLGRKWRGTSNHRTRISPARHSFVLEVPRHLRPSIIISVPCDRIVQRAYYGLS